MCKAPRWVTPYPWPFGVDLVVQGFKSGRQKKLLAFMADKFEAMGPTVQIDLLGGKGFATMDSENIETILSSKFEGKIEDALTVLNVSLTMSAFRL